VDPRCCDERLRKLWGLRMFVEIWEVRPNPRWEHDERRVMALHKGGWHAWIEATIHSDPPASTAKHNKVKVLFG
jgi:hypothetical protein